VAQVAVMMVRIFMGFLLLLHGRCPCTKLEKSEFVDLDNDALEDVGEVDLVFDVIGGDIGKRSARLIRAGGTLVSIVGPSEARPADGLAVDFVVESDRAQLSEIVQRVRDGRLRTNIGNVSALDDAVATFNATERRAGKTVIRVRP
jgi:NADPH:quinone reductase-like Zn-dependent oxidoreductase